MVMMSIIGFFLAVVWLIMPFVVFAIKGKQDRTLEVLEAIEKRLSSLESTLLSNSPGAKQSGSSEYGSSSSRSSDNKEKVVLAETSVVKKDFGASTVV
jgi:hypothetical protein